MVWTFQRERQMLRLEVRNVGADGKWEMTLEHPNGHTVTEQFGRRDLLQSYLVAVQDTLRASNWNPVGAEEVADKSAGLRLVANGGVDDRAYAVHGEIESQIRDVQGDATEVFDLSEVQEDIPREWNAAAQYALEEPARCPHCREPLNAVRVLRLKRTQVSFTSSLPRAGSAIVCPLCERIISAELGGRL